MSRNQRGGGVMENVTDVAAVVETPVVGNRTAVFHSFHPKQGTPDRVSYKVDGIPGAIYMFLTLFKDGIAPQTLTLDCELAEPKPDGKQAKIEAAAVRATEKAIKAQERLDAQQAKAMAAAVKAQEALDAAKAKLESPSA